MLFKLTTTQNFRKGIVVINRFVARLAMACLLFAGLTGAALASGAQGAGPRLALVIGNADYRHYPRLAGAASDADAMADALRARGFRVTKANNVEREAMMSLIAQFEQTLAARGGIGVFFYSGHAAQANGDEIMFAVDAREASGADIVKQGINVSRLRRPIAAPAAGSWRDNGSVTLYASSKGQVTLDSLPGQRNSPFTTALLGALGQGSGDIQTIFERVRNSLEVAFRDPALREFKQVPDLSGRLNQEIFINQPDRDPTGTISRILFFDSDRSEMSAAPVKR